MLCIWRTYFAEERVDLFPRRHTVRDRIANASKIPTEVVNVLGLPPLVSVKPLQATFDLVSSSFPQEKVQK